MIGLPERIEILKLAASLLPGGPQATMRSRVMAALNLADILECNLSAGRSFITIGIRVAPCPLADWAALSVPASVDRLGDLGQQIEHGILVRRNGVRKGVEQAGDKALTGKFPVGVSRHDESSPVSGVEAYRLEDAGDGVMSSPDTAAIPDDFDAAQPQLAACSDAHAGTTHPFHGPMPERAHQGSLSQYAMDAMNHACPGQTYALRAPAYAVEPVRAPFPSTFGTGNCPYG
ncbi:MAG: hypothetical protein JJK57_14100 [Komagataeibacter hansenii]|nr:hypothetical protein [Novacetimonas hansenii]